MKYVRVARERGARTFMLVFEAGDDFFAELIRFSRTERVGTGRLTGIGGFSNATLGHFDREGKRFEPTVVNDQVEVLSLSGTLSVMDGEPHAHIHASVSFRDASVKGGHLLAGTVWPTIEAFVSEYGGVLRRSMVPEIGAAFIDLAEGT
jgi:hypothetical protein